MKLSFQSKVLIYIIICNAIIFENATRGMTTTQSCLPPMVVNHNSGDLIFKDCIPEGMLISWELVKGFKHQGFKTVRFYPKSMISSIDDEPNLAKCISFNVSDAENKILFNRSKGFKKDQQYIIQIREFSNKDNLPTKNIFRNIGSCPWSGSWSKWTPWSSCSCQQAPDKPQTRTKHCQVKTKNKTLHLPNIQCQGLQAIPTKSCYAECRPYLDSTTTTIQPSASSKQSWMLNKLETSLMAGGLALLIILIICFMVVYVAKKRKSIKSSLSNQHQQTPSENISIYVSHFQQTDSEEKELLALIHYITRFGIQCHVDLLCQVEINTMGGLPNWIPTNILNVKKIMVYLTKKYIKALKDHVGKYSPQQDDEDEVDNNLVCKIHTEYAYIKTLIHHTINLKESPLVLILDKGVNFEDLPVEFQGLPFCYFPKRLKTSVDDNCRQLISLLTDVEPLQMATEFTGRSMVDDSQGANFNSVHFNDEVYETTV